MKHSIMKGNNPSATRARLLAPLPFLALASCVSQQQYDDAVATARYHQTSLHEEQQRTVRLESEIERLKRQLAQNDVSALSEAGFGDDLSSRISELQSQIDGLGRPVHDIEKFDVEGGYVVMVQDKILFESGSADLTAEGRENVVKIAADINARPHGRIWVRGHTDSDPVVKPATKEKFPHGNLQLSAARAIEVASELSSSGKVPSRDVAVAGFGPHDPVKPNNGPDNKRMNRRVEIFVADGGGAKAEPAAAPAPEKK